MTALALAHGLTFANLHERDGLVRLDGFFVRWLVGVDAGLHAKLMAARAAPEAMAAKEESNLLIELGPSLEDFVGDLFGVTEEVATLRARHNELAALFDCKRLFVQRYVTRAIKPDAAAVIDGAEATNAIAALVEFADVTPDRLEAAELRYAQAVKKLLGPEFKVETATAEIE